jgi:hypothetical protein
MELKLFRKYFEKFLDIKIIKSPTILVPNYFTRTDERTDRKTHAHAYTHTRARPRAHTHTHTYDEAISHFSQFFEGS